MAATRGRPRKGKDRVVLPGKVEREHRELYEQLASKLGLDMVDYVALKMAEVHGHEVPDYIRGPLDEREHADQFQLELVPGPAPRHRDERLSA